MSKTDAPIYFSEYNSYGNLVQPSSLHSGSGLHYIFARSLLQKAESVLEFDLPDTWPVNYVLNRLYVNGYLAVIKTDDFGVIPMECTVGGFNVFRQPAWVTIANPLLQDVHQLTIGEDCTLLRLQPDYMGIMDTVNYYADLMATCAAGAGINVLNSKLAYILKASNKAAASTAAKIFDDIASGKPAVIVDQAAMRDGSLDWELFNRDVKASLIAPELVDLIRTLEQRFLTEVGIANANTQKRERLITDEVNANNAETLSRCSLWLQELQRSIQDTNDMFGTNISVKLRSWSAPVEEAVENVEN